MRDLSKKAQLSYRRKRKDIPRGYDKEEPMQMFADTYLESHRIPYIRIPDNMWGWIMRFAPQWVKNICSKHLAGWPDNMPVKPIAPGFGLVCFIENKSKTGQLQGKQKKMSDEFGYIVCRTPEDFVEAMEKMNDLHDKIMEAL
jgi:hypothetical protein